MTIFRGGSQKPPKTPKMVKKPLFWVFGKPEKRQKEPRIPSRFLPITGKRCVWTGKTPKKGVFLTPFWTRTTRIPGKIGFFGGSKTPILGIFGHFWGFLTIFDRFLTILGFLPKTEKTTILTFFGVKNDPFFELKIGNNQDFYVRLGVFWPAQGRVQKKAKK